MMKTCATITVLLLAAAHAASASLDGTWVTSASPARLVAQNSGLPSLCKCAPDPILPNPACILCLCNTNKTGTPQDASAKALVTKGCGMSSTTEAVLKYNTGATQQCGCAPDPFLKASQWILCDCPGPNPLQIPTTQTYTAWPVPADKRSSGSPSLKQWPVCAGEYALCSFANCTMNFKGKGASTIPLAECGCVTATQSNGLKKISLVDPAYILDESLKRATDTKCPNGTQSAGCAKPNTTPICAAIGQNTIYAGAYDMVSTFTMAPNLGGFNKMCVRPKADGLYAQCMTAACFKKKAWDGSPVTCYCPVYKASKYVVGSPVGVNASCLPNPPYVLSGVEGGAPKWR